MPEGTVGSSNEHQADSPAGLRACAYPMAWRVVAAALVGVSRASLPVIGLGILVAEEPAALRVLAHVLAVCALLPGVAAWLIERAFVVDVEVWHGGLIAQRRDLRLEVPSTAIARVVPWALPLPGPGCSLWMRSGRRLRYGLQLIDPTPLLSALANVAGVEAARAALHHPIVVYAHAKRGAGRRRWHYFLGKFVLFALVPTAVWFNAHQHIAYGGLLGQYYLEGLVPYLTTFGVSWGLASIYVLLYASIWRAAAEGVALLAAWIAPARARAVRRAVEVTCGVVYYGGVPLLVLLPFLR